jgi:peptidoglycan-associated lipoprotein
MFMKNIVVFLFVSFLIAQSAKAAEWELFAENNDQQYYLDENSIQCSEVTCSFCTRCCLPSLDRCISDLPQQYVRVWTRKIPKHPEKYQEIEELTFQESACETGMRRLLHRTLLYSDGTSDSVNLNVEIKWDPITTNPIIESLHAYLCSLFQFGCSQKPVAQQVKPVAQQLSDATMDKRGALKPEERITEQQLAKIETTEEPARFSEESGLFADIQFDFDKYDIKPEARQVLNAVSSWLLKNPSANLSVEGHCDERGTNEYNLALGDRRAKSVRDFLIALGVASKRIEIVSYGEEKPQCMEQTEECWAKNRRAHFVVLR